MAGWNGSGTFTLPYDWEADAAAGINIQASRMQGQDTVIASLGFGNTLTRDGQGQPSANLPMNGFKHTGATVASASGEYVVYQQITSGLLNATFIDLAATGNLTVTGNVSVSGSLTTTLSVVGPTVVANAVIIIAGHAPATASSAGTAGTMAWDTSYFYVCTATNTWKRVAIATF